MSALDASVCEANRQPGRRVSGGCLTPPWVLPRYVRRSFAFGIHIAAEIRRTPGCLFVHLHFQGKKNVVPGFDGATGALNNRSISGRDNGTQDRLASRLDGGAIEADDGIASLDDLAFHGDFLKALALKLNSVKPEMHDQLDATLYRNTERVSASEEFDQLPGCRSHRDRSCRINRQAIAGHFQREHLIWHAFQIDNRAIEWRENVDKCHACLLSAGGPAFNAGTARRSTRE